MPSKPDPIPKGFHTVTPYLVIQGVAQVLDFAQRAFDAKIVHVSKMPNGVIMHATIQVGDSMVMLGEARQPADARPAMLYLYVKDVDQVYQQALEAGGVSIQVPTNAVYGDRNGGVKDCAGNQWWIGTHIEDVSPEEIEHRAKTAKH